MTEKPSENKIVESRINKIHEKVLKSQIESAKKKEKNNFIIFMILAISTIITALCYYLNYKPMIMLGLISSIINLWNFFMIAALYFLIKFLFIKRSVEKLKKDCKKAT